MLVVDEAGPCLILQQAAELYCQTVGPNTAAATDTVRTVLQLHVRTVGEALQLPGSCSNLNPHRINDAFLGDGPGYEASQGHAE